MKWVEPPHLARGKVKRYSHTGKQCLNTRGTKLIVTPSNSAPRNPLERSEDTPTRTYIKHRYSRTAKTGHDPVGRHTAQQGSRPERPSAIKEQNTKPAAKWINLGNITQSGRKPEPKTTQCLKFVWNTQEWLTSGDQKRIDSCLVLGVGVEIACKRALENLRGWWKCSKPDFSDVFPTL